MRNVFWFLVRGLLLLLLCLPARPAAAVILYLKDQDQPIRGYYVRENEHAVVLLELLPNGSTAERSVPRTQIDDMIRSVSEERLAALRPENPDAYREYAEELAEKRKDPDAQLTGLRLYQMAAVLEPQRLGRSCLLGMVPLRATRPSCAGSGPWPTCWTPTMIRRYCGCRSRPPFGPPISTRSRRNFS